MNQKSPSSGKTNQIPGKLDSMDTHWLARNDLRAVGTLMLAETSTGPRSRQGQELDPNSVLEGSWLVSMARWAVSDWKRVVFVPSRHAKQLGMHGTGLSLKFEPISAVEHWARVPQNGSPNSYISP